MEKTHRFLLWLLFLPLSVVAQPVHVGERSVSIEYFEPSFKLAYFQGTTIVSSGSYTASATFRYRTSESSWLMVIVPYNRTELFHYEPPFGYFQGRKETTIREGIGNIVLASEYRSPSSGLSFRMKLGLPTLTEKKRSSAVVGWLSDPMHIERYVYKKVGVIGDFYWTIPREEIVGVILHTGISMFAQITKGPRESFALVSYGGGLAFNAGPVRISGIVDGMRILTDHVLTNDGTKTLAFGQFEFSVTFGRVQPKITYRGPFDKTFKVITRSVVGLSVRISG